MSRTSIEWTQATWNPTRGCSPVSPGCKHCYAERKGGRFAGPGEPFDGFVQIGKNGNPGAHWTGKVELIEHMLEIPLRTKKPTMWFVNSMSDLFHESLPDGAIDRVFAVMQHAYSRGHKFQILTKRAARMQKYFAAALIYDRWLDAVNVIRSRWSGMPWIGLSNPATHPLPHVWLGVSAEDQQRADERIPLLLQTPAAVRFVSAEPLLGPINFHCAHGFCLCPTPKLDWMIAGGESGPGARPCDIAWIRSIRDQCKEAGVACFVKQLGAKPILAREANGAFCPDYEYFLHDRKGGDMAEWPDDLRVRQMP